MIVICEKCSTLNRIDDPENINNYACGNCRHKLLGLNAYDFPSTTVIVSAVVGACIGCIMIGPAGLIIGSIAGFCMAAI